MRREVSCVFEPLLRQCSSYALSFPPLVDYQFTQITTVLGIPRWVSLFLVGDEHADDLLSDRCDGALFPLARQRFATMTHVGKNILRRILQQRNSVEKLSETNDFLGRSFLG